ncbi:hypothetical protein BDY19DRAFT_620149 [Irpex rosettiformis]|uniref:Uncharacterized protein n=1 Tax=Irpex rosettiformis TaxID=378272 RepID=A0ACB8TNR1_9APHY|nr:hypothetical protein BDY19DRAFT_620149 [Irpex rosettiformis]
MLTLYEYCLTFSQERELIWRRKISVVSILFLINRYALILQGIFNTIKLSIWIEYYTDSEGWVDGLPQACAVVSWFGVACEYLISLAFSVFSAVRTYAIWEHDKRILAILLVLGSMYGGCSIYGMTKLTSPLPTHGCLLYANISRSLTRPSGAADVLLSGYQQWLSFRNCYRYSHMDKDHPYNTRLKTFRPKLRPNVGIRHLPRRFIKLCNHFHAVYHCVTFLCLGAIFLHNNAERYVRLYYRLETHISFETRLRTHGWGYRIKLLVAHPRHITHSI